LQLAEKDAARKTHVAQAEKVVVQKLQAELDAKQRELESFIESEKVEEEAAKKVVDDIGVVTEEASEKKERDALALQTAQTLSADEQRTVVAEQTQSHDLQVRLEAIQRQLQGDAEVVLKLNDQLQTMQSRLEELTRANQTSAQAAEEAARDAQDLPLKQQKARDEATWSAKVARVEAVKEAQQRDLKAMEERKNLEAKLEFKRRVLKMATDAEEAKEKAADDIQVKMEQEEAKLQRQKQRIQADLEGIQRELKELTDAPDRAGGRSARADAWRRRKELQAELEAVQRELGEPTGADQAQKQAAERAPDAQASQLDVEAERAKAVAEAHGRG